MPDIVNNPTLGMYVAAAVALVVLLGFFIYLWAIDRRVRELDRRLREQDERRDRPTDAPHRVLRPRSLDTEVHDGVDRH